MGIADDHIGESSNSNKTNSLLKNAEGDKTSDVGSPLKL